MPESDRKFFVGYARLAIDPPAGIGLGGFGNTNSRLSEKVLDDICVTCVALHDPLQTVLMYTVDYLGVSLKNYKVISEWIQENLSVPAENVFITATHNHSAPQVRDGSASVEPYMPAFYEGMYEVARLALKDLAEAKIAVGSARTEHLNYVRRYLREDGSFVGANYFSKSTAPIARHESEADNLMQVIRFERPQKKDVVMVNWQCHVTTTSGLKRTDVSADLVGAFRDASEDELGVLFAYYQGAAGNVVPGSSLPGETRNDDHIKHGKDLTLVLKKALSDMKPVEPSPIRILHHNYYGLFQTDTEGKDLEQAKEICSAFDSGDSQLVRNLCLEYGFHSYYHAKAILGRSRMKKGIGKEIQLAALSLGMIGMVFAPYEMYDTNGMQIKERSPFDMTFICAYTNDAYGYIPSALGYKNGGYEVDACAFAAGTGEALVEEYLKLLEKVKGTKE